MFGWFSSKSTCPVEASTREWIDARWVWLEEQFGIERPRTGPAVVPRPECFPDRYDGTGQDARGLLDRVCGYMDIDPATVVMTLYQEEQDPIGSHPALGPQSRSGTAGLYQERDGKYWIGIEAANLDDPMGLIGTLAHELGHVHLLGHGRISPETEDHEPVTDLLTVYLGMGVFTANSVIREEHWQRGRSSGWKIGRKGYLNMPSYGYALALFARSRGEERPAWSRELRLDVRSAFEQAMRFLAEEEDADPNTP